MDMLETVRQAITQKPASRLKEIAAGASVPYMTIRKVAFGPTKNPRYDTIRKIAEFLNQEQA